MRLCGLSGCCWRGDGQRWRSLSTCQLIIVCLWLLWAVKGADVKSRSAFIINLHFPVRCGGCGLQCVNRCSSPESLNELEDTDLDALMADLMADLNATEEKFAAQQEDLRASFPPPPDLPPPPAGLSPHPTSAIAYTASPAGSYGSDVSTPASSGASPLPPPPPQATKPTKVRCWTASSLLTNISRFHLPPVFFLQNTKMIDCRHSMSLYYFRLLKCKA